MAIARDKGASSRYSGITKHKTPYALKAKIMLKVALLERLKKNKIIEEPEIQYTKIEDITSIFQNIFC